MSKESITEWFKYWFLTKPEPEKTVEKKPKRARTVRGHYKADDKSTSNVNEAWESGKAPSKSGLHKKKSKKKK